MPNAVTASHLWVQGSAVGVCQQGLAVEPQQRRRKLRLGLLAAAAHGLQQGQEQKCQGGDQRCRRCRRGRGGGQVDLDAGQAAAEDVGRQQGAAAAAAQVRHGIGHEPQQQRDLPRGQLAHRRRERRLEAAALQDGSRRVGRSRVLWRLPQRLCERQHQGLQLAEFGKRSHQAARHLHCHRGGVERRAVGCCGAGRPQEQRPEEGQLLLDHSVLNSQDALNHAQRCRHHRRRRRRRCLLSTRLRQRQRCIRQLLQQRALLAGGVLGGPVELQPAQGGRQEGHATATVGNS